MSDSLNRRSFIGKTVLGGISLAGLVNAPIETQLEAATANVNRLSSPSKLKITDLRYVVVEHLGRPCPILRIDTNQGISGYGEVRDGGDKRYALILKSRILGENPCNVERLFKEIKPYGGHNRMGGGVSGIEMALWDLAGKAYGVPVWQLLGGRYRDKVRLYADTHGSTDWDLIASKVKNRVNNEGYTWLKMTRCYKVLEGLDGAYADSHSEQLSSKGIAAIADYLKFIRETVGFDVAISADHMGDRSVENAIRLGKTFDSVRLAWMEEPVDWRNPEQLKEVKEAIETPVGMGEVIYGRELFQQYCDMRAIDLVHPDLATAGGILETKKIGDYAQDCGIEMALHYAGTPVSFMANVHSAAATENASALEYHPEGPEIDEWNSMANLVDGRPFIENGFANVPEAPGLGLELNMEGIEAHLHPEDTQIFPDTSEWDDRSGAY